jgi:hypothetical protein
MNDEEQLKKIDVDFENEKWIIDRIDRWRVSIASRCSIILSADAIILTGTIFLINKDNRALLSSDPSIKSITIILLIILSVTIFLSILFATIGIANVFKTGRYLYGKNIPDRLYFHPSDVIKNCNNFQDFILKYSNCNEDQIRIGLWAEIWSIIKMQNMRYQYLKKSVFLLVLTVTILLFIVCLITFSNI